MRGRSVRRRGLPALLLAGAALAIGACGGAGDELARAARADLRPTEGHEARGTVRFEPAADGVGLRVRTEASGLPPGAHAYHVHLYGDCSAPDATSAGTHFNFVGPSQDPPEGIDRITGNLGELVADESGRATHEAHVELARLHGPASVVGRAVVVHARANDPASPPIGAAGPRLACGVIGIDEPEG